MDFYAVLGVPRYADAASIRRAYRALARRFHPDAGEGSSAERFRQVVEAYATLSDPVRRRIYDTSLAPRRTVRPEPMVQPGRAPRPSGVHPEEVYIFSRMTGFDRLVEELLRSLERELLFGRRRFRW